MATRSLGTLTLDLIAKISGFTDPLSQAERHAKKTARELNAQADAIKKQWGSLGTVLKGAFVGLIGGSILDAFIRETIEAQESQAQLAAVLKSTGNAAGFAQSQLNDMAGALSAATTFADDDVTKAQTVLLKFTNIVGDKLPAALQASADMAARTGQSIDQAAQTIGKALSMPERGMAMLAKQVGGFSDAQIEAAKSLAEMGRVAEAQQIILDGLAKSYGGAAEAARDTLGGALAALKNAVSDLLEGDDGSVSGLVSAINSLTDALRMPEARAAIEAVAKGAAAAATAIGVYYVGALAVATAGAIAAAGATATLAAAMAVLTGPVGLALLAGATVAVAAYVSKVKEIGKEASEAADGAAQMNAAVADTAEVATKTSATYDSMLAKLRERSAMIGKTTEAEKLAARIQLGLIEDISAAEGAALVARTAAVDAQESAYKRSIAAQEAARKVAEETAREQERQRESINAQIAEMRDAVTVWGMSSDAVAIYKAQLAGATDAQIEQMRVLQEAQRIQRDSQAASTAAQAKQDQINADVQALAEGLKTEEERIRESYERRRDMILSATGDAAEKQSELLARIEEERNAALADLQKDYWDKWLDAAQEHLTSFDELAGDTIENLSNQFGSAFESMVFDAESLRDAIGKLAEGVARSMVNAIGQMIGQWLALKAVQMMTGKSAQSASVLAMTANAQAASIQAGINAYASTAAIPIVGPAMAPAAMAQALAVTGAMATSVAGLSAAGLAGMAHDGMQSIPKTGTWLLEKGERVTTEATSAKLDATLDAIRRDQKPASAQPNVNIRAVNVLDPSIVGDYLGTSAGERTVINIMRRNRRLVGAG